jgi:hypothetical protein
MKRFALLALLIFAMASSSKADSTSVTYWAFQSMNILEPCDCLISGTFTLIGDNAGNFFGPANVPVWDFTDGVHSLNQNNSVASFVQPDGRLFSQPAQAEGLYVIKIFDPTTQVAFNMFWPTGSFEEYFDGIFVGNSTYGASPPFLVTLANGETAFGCVVAGCTFDRLEQVFPNTEPSTLVLVSSGLLGLAFIRLKRF